MITPRIRGAAAQVLTGGRINRIAHEVEAALTWEGSRGEEAGTAAITDHAVSRVPFYRELGTREFTELPVIDKGVMRDRGRDFLADGADPAKLDSASTSGSTGVPFTAYFDPGKVLRHRGGLVGTYRFMGADPYGPLVHNRHWPRLSARSRLAFALKGHLPYAGTHHDQLTPDQVAEWLRKRPGASIMGYASYVESLLRAFEDAGLTFAPGEVQAVIAGSEPATGYLREGARRLFGITPHMRYSNMEIGMLAVTGEDPDVYHIDISSFHIEILAEDSDEPVAPGELGRIVVTDLHNRAMPFLRYDTGDLGRFPLNRDGREQRTRLTDIRGRRLDVLVAGTQEHPQWAHPMQIWGATAQISELRQFQLRQHDVGHFTWVLNAEKSAAVQARLREILDEHVGDIVSCEFSYVDEVPVLASGKRQFFVNEIPDAQELLTRATTRTRR